MKMTGFSLDWLLEKQNLNRNSSLQTLNEALLNENFNIMLAIMFIMVVGIISNVTCITVYWKAINPSRFRTYVLYISTIEILSCLLYMPTVVIVLLYPLMYPTESGCILHYYIGDFTILAGVIALLIISVERVCHVYNPMKTIVSREQVKVGFFFGIFSSILAASPTLKIMGLTEIEITGLNMSAKICYLEEEFIGTEFANGYVILTNLLRFTLCCISLILAFIYMIKMHFSPHFHLKEEYLNKHLMFSRNLTIMMFITTLKYSFAYMPFSMFKAIHYIKHHRISILPYHGIVMYYIFGLAMALNNVLNPFVYGYYDNRFRQVIGSMFFTFTHTHLEEESEIIVDQEYEKKSKMSLMKLFTRTHKADSLKSKMHFPGQGKLEDNPESKISVTADKATEIKEKSNDEKEDESEVNIRDHDEHTFRTPCETVYIDHY